MVQTFLRRHTVSIDRLPNTTIALLTHNLRRLTRKALRWELSLYVGTLEAIIHLTDQNSIFDSPRFLDMIENMVYGRPRRVWEPKNVSERIKAPCEDSNKEFWEENVPVIRF